MIGFAKLHQHPVLPHAAVGGNGIQQGTRASGPSFELPVCSMPPIFNSSAACFIGIARTAQCRRQTMKR